MHVYIYTYIYLSLNKYIYTPFLLLILCMLLISKLQCKDIHVITSYLITLIFGLLIKSYSLPLSMILRNQSMRPLALSSLDCYIVFEAYFHLVR